SRVTVAKGSLDAPKFIDSMIDTALKHADTLRGAVFLNGGFGTDNGIGADGFTEQLQKLLVVSVFPTTTVLSRVLPYWKAYGRGRFALTAATVAEQRSVFGGAYATSDMAVDSLAKQFQREYNPEVVDVPVLRPKFIGDKSGHDAPADLAQEMI